MLITGQKLLHIHHHCCFVGSDLAALQPLPQQLRCGCSSRVLLCGGDYLLRTHVLLCCDLGGDVPSWARVLQQLPPRGFMRAYSCRVEVLPGRSGAGSVGAVLAAVVRTQLLCMWRMFGVCGTRLAHRAVPALCRRDCFAGAGAWQQGGPLFVVLALSSLKHNSRGWHLAGSFGCSCLRDPFWVTVTPQCEPCQTDRDPLAAAPAAPVVAAVVVCIQT